MHLQNPAWQNTSVLFESFKQLSQTFFEKLDKEAVAKLDARLIAQSLPQSGASFVQLIEQLESQIIPQLSAARGPRYWGFVTGGATPIATFADWLVATFDQNVHKGGDSIATEVERQALEWLCELFSLPPEFKGVMPTGATSCNFLGACCARQFAGQQQGIDVAKTGVGKLDLAIFSTTPHASMVKSLGMCGLGQQNWQPIKALPNSEAMDIADLKHCMQKCKAKSIFVIASAGTVTTTDFDDLSAISKLCQQHRAWLHVDAAFGLFERVVAGPQGKTKGIDLADSITVDCHKWLNVPYDCGVFLTRHLDLLEQSFDVPAPYLANSSGRPDFMSLGVENSRRFRAFPVWLSLLAYGKVGVKSWVESNIRLAKYLADWIDDSEDYELVHPCNMNVVLFRPNSRDQTPQQADRVTQQRLQQINSDGRIFLSPGLWQDQQIIRVALSNWQTQQADIDIAIQVLKDFSKKG